MLRTQIQLYHSSDRMRCARRLDPTFSSERLRGLRAVHAHSIRMFTARNLDRTFYSKSLRARGVRDPLTPLNPFSIHGDGTGRVRPRFGFFISDVASRARVRRSLGHTTRAQLSDAVDVFFWPSAWVHKLIGNRLDAFNQNVYSKCLFKMFILHFHPHHCANRLNTVERVPL